jgi:hypothetical protein
MSTTIAPGMTTEELLALPENGMDRELIRGEVKEKFRTYRNRFNNEETLSGDATLPGVEIAVAELFR